MAKTCNSCGTDKNPANVSYVVYESAMARSEREKKRLWILLIISWVAVLLVVGIFTYERLQYDYTSETYEEVIVDSKDGGNANYIGNDGDIINGENNSEKNNGAETP